MYKILYGDLCFMDKKDFGEINSENAFEPAKIEVITFDSEDVITTSGLTVSDFDDDEMNLDWNSRW